MPDPHPRGVVILNDTRVDNHHGCDRVMRTLEGQLTRIGCRILATSPAHADWRRSDEVMAALDSARLIVVNGEGTLHHDRPAALTLLEAGQHGAARGIPTVLLNSGWEANGSQAAGMVRGFTLVAVRDSRSKAELDRLGVPCTMVPDLSLYRAHAAGDGRRGTGFTDSVNREAAMALERARRQCHGVAVPIQHSRRGGRGAWRFFRSYIGARDVRRPRFLATMLRISAQHFRHQVQSDGELLALIASLRLLVSGRFHACTFSLLAGTPFVAAATTTGKITTLINDAGLSSWRATASLAPTDIAEAGRLGWESHEPEAIADFLAEGRSRTDALFAEIGRLL